MGPRWLAGTGCCCSASTRRHRVVAGDPPRRISRLWINRIGESHARGSHEARRSFLFGFPTCLLTASRSPCGASGDWRRVRAVFGSLPDFVISSRSHRRYALTTRPTIIALARVPPMRLHIKPSVRVGRTRFAHAYPMQDGRCRGAQVRADRRTNLRDLFSFGAALHTEAVAPPFFF